MAGEQFIRSSGWILNAKRRQSLLSSGLTPGVKARSAAFTLTELLIVIAVVFIWGVWLAQECVKLSTPLITEPTPGYNGGFAGVGITIEKDGQSDAVQISKITPRSPAALAKLSPGFVIEEIDGVTTHGISLQECQMRIRGQAGTNVRLTLASPDRNEMTVVELTRQS